MENHIYTILISFDTGLIVGDKVSEHNNNNNKSLIQKLINTYPYIISNHIQIDGKYIGLNLCYHIFSGILNI